MATADPLGGSYYIEALTDELEARALELIDRIDELGGAVAAVEAGWVQAEIEAAAYGWTTAVESGERTIVGVNAFAETSAGESIELLRPDPDAERRQVERTRAVREACDATAAERARARVREAAQGSDNMLPSLREALAAHCTVGELCTVLREEWGAYSGSRRG
jgi:methylmalonyl-CoA mutase N-terminal domain/subunit